MQEVDINKLVYNLSNLNKNIPNDKIIVGKIDKLIITCGRMNNHITFVQLPDF